MKRLVVLLLLVVAFGVQGQAGTPRALWDDQDFAAIVASRAVPFTPDIEPFFFSHEVIPPTIKVGITGYLHCRDWLNAGQPVERIDEMPFSEYVKNVLPNEWVSSWSIESLRAGAMAVKMFAWWRLNLGGVRPGGAHVVDNTCDQVYIANSARPSTDAAVDDTWNMIMRSGGRVVEIHYLNTDENCELYFPGIRCMGQWGSKALADSGMGWQDILRFYYDPVEITQGEAGLPDLPESTDIIRNGGFSAGFDEWAVFGDASRALYDGVLAFQRRANEGDSGGVSQSLPYTFPEGAALEVTLELGNSSSVTKQPRVFIRDAFDADDYVVCQFTIPPGTPLQPYVMRASAGDWHNPRLEIWPDPADSQPDVLLDNVTLQHHPTLQLNGTHCHAPSASTRWHFESSGWVGLENPRHDPAGGMRYDTPGTLVSPLLLDANTAAYTHLMLQMAGDSCGSVSFLLDGQTVFTEAQQVSFAPIGDGHLHTTYVELAAHPSWSGNVTRLRLECPGTGEVRLVSAALLDVNTTPILLAPSGTISDGSGRPAYTWRPVPGATAYQLYVADSEGTLRVYDRFPADCTQDTCTIRPGVRLSAGTHAVYLRPWFGEEPGAWVGAFNFTLQTPPPALVELTGTTLSTRPTFHWRSTAATHYRVYLAPSDDLGTARVDDWFAHADICEGAACALESPVDLTNGRYSLYVQSYGVGGLSDGFAGPETFTLALPRPTIPPNVTINDGLIAWDDAPEYAWVQLYVGTDDGQQVYLNWQRKNCAAGRCAGRLDLPNGVYQLFIRVWGAGGASNWGGPLTFTLNEPAPAAPAVALTATSSGRPIFTWAAVEHATWYRLEIHDRHDQWVSHTDICDDSGCTVRPPLDLPNGVYPWSVTVWGAGGLSPVQSGTLSVNAAIPMPPRLLEPRGLTYTLTPRFVWEPVQDSLWYQVQIQQGETPLYEGWHGCCEVVPPEVRLGAGAFSWRARAYNPGGVGNWSAWQTFTNNP